MPKGNDRHREGGELSHFETRRYDRRGARERRGGRTRPARLLQVRRDQNKQARLALQEMQCHGQAPNQVLQGSKQDFTFGSKQVLHVGVPEARNRLSPTKAKEPARSNPLWPYLCQL